MIEVAQIGMKLAVVDGATTVLSSIATQMLKIEGYEKRIRDGFLAWKPALLGVSAIIAGGGILAGLKSVADHGDKLLDQQDKLQRAGMSLNEVLKQQAIYYDKVAKSVPTSTAADYLRTFNELRSVVGAERAEAKTPWAMKLESLMSNMTGKSAEGQGFKLLRALEMKGITISDPAMSDKLADIMVKNIIGSGGKLTASDFEQMAKTGGVAWQRASPRFIATALSNIASDMGGSRTGTALMTLYQTLSGGVSLGKAQIEEFERLGLLNMKQVGWNKKLDLPIMKVDSFKNGALALTDPDLWVQQMVLPALDRVYGGDAEKRARSLAILGRNRNTQRMMMMFADPGFREQMTKDYALWAQASSPERGYDDALRRNPAMIKDAFGKQYESMMQAIGAPLMQAAIPVMKAVTDMFTKIGAFANRNPETIANIAKGLAALSAVLIGAGGVALLAALGAGGWFVVGLGSLAAAIVTFPKEKLSQIGATLGALWDSITGKFNAFLEGMRSWGERFGAWLNSLIAKLGSFLGISLGGGGGGSYADSAARMRAMGATGASNLPIMARGGGGDIVSLGKSLQAQGLRVSEHPAFGGVHPVHHGLGHYQGRAIDVNFGHGVNEASNPAIGSRFDALASALRGKGYKVIWRAPGHYNHMHVESPRGGRVSFTPPNKRLASSGGGDVVLKVDGRELGRVASQQIARVHEHSRQAPHFNGRGMFAGPDLQFAVG